MITISITENDIIAFDPNPTNRKHRSYSCPNSLIINRLLKEGFVACTTPLNIIFEKEGEGFGEGIEQPLEFHGWMREFDEGNARPFKYELNIPEKFLKGK